MSIIRFEQAIKITNEADKFDEALIRYQKVCYIFQKSPLIQMSAWDIWAELLDINDYWAQKDYSQMLLDRTNKAIKDFEELQETGLLEDTKKVLVEAIKRANLRES